jgi:glycerol-3-phosphate acyltransferase PlsY
MACCGLAAVIGHCFPVYLGFRGGKGVATLVGAFLALDLVAVATGAAAFAVTLAVLRTVALSSLALALTLAAMMSWRHGLEEPGALVALVAVALVAWTHRSNWRRLLAGGEGRAFERSGRGGGERHG